ncbi:hypothetical protein PROFUN_06999 [Planoprotostelium fungivorum]|uniref:Uncharacterized protein n=1 Tax=Planoprotostelium fungivorum TaxID=1890364 RepID=A0A2P6NMR8_9EUKA|nr:hypothetical protein PROFUN_06999 [Planoprotostelium fungivorum]
MSNFFIPQLMVLVNFVKQPLEPEMFNISLDDMTQQLQNDTVASINGTSTAHQGLTSGSENKLLNFECHISFGAARESSPLKSQPMLQFERHGGWVWILGAAFFENDEFRREDHDLPSCRPLFLPKGLYDGEEASSIERVSQWLSLILRLVVTLWPQSLQQDRRILQHLAEYRFGYLLIGPLKRPSPCSSR